MASCRRSHSVAVRGEGLRVCAVRRSSSARSTPSCCLRRRGSNRSTHSTASTRAASCGYCVTRSAAPRKISTTSTTSTASTTPRKTSTTSTASTATQQQQQRRVSGRLAGPQMVGRVAPHPHLCLQEAEEGAAPPWEVLGGRGVGEAAAKGAARQVVGALRHLHTHGLVHRDLRPCNIRVEGRRPLLVRLGGLGLAAEEGALVRRGQAPLAWLAPEVASLLPAEGYAAHPSQDAWQLGLLLVTCLTGALPWAAPHPTDPHYAAWAAWACRSSTRLPPRFRVLSPRCLRLLRRLLQPRPQQRAGVREVEKYLQDAWVGGEQAKGVLRRRVGGLLGRAGACLTRLITPTPTPPHAHTRVAFKQDTPPPQLSPP
ncbi:Serine/threonine-protein kinase meng-po [Chionoecetes opilio]|uniref:Serine/threonine-protein kinase meng-po n=1 Tax=Chionoecetes opilio TaxID=41210 RepID=A0A8J5CY74_CHIOP|nr:Serine/threonine-protein kinase meng-po [Chionoecetes opilio]